MNLVQILPSDIIRLVDQYKDIREGGDNIPYYDPEEMSAHLGFLRNDIRRIGYPPQVFGPTCLLFLENDKQPRKKLFLEIPQSVRKQFFKDMNFPRVFHYQAVALFKLKMLAEICRLSPLTYRDFLKNRLSFDLSFLPLLQKFPPSKKWKDFAIFWDREEQPSLSIPQKRTCKPEDLEAISAFKPHCLSLHGSWQRLTTPSNNALRRMTSLKELSLSYFKQDPEDRRIKLEGLKNLTSLCLFGDAILRSLDFESLTRLPKLQALEISSFHSVGIDCRSLLSNPIFQAITQLRFEPINNIHAQKLLCINNMPNLVCLDVDLDVNVPESLRLSHQQLGEVTAQMLQQLPALRFARLSALSYTYNDANVRIDLETLSHRYVKQRNLSEQGKRIIQNLENVCIAIGCWHLFMKDHHINYLNEKHLMQFIGEDKAIDVAWRIERNTSAADMYKVLHGSGLFSSKQPESPFSDITNHVVNNPLFVPTDKNSVEASNGLRKRLNRKNKKSPKKIF